MTTALFKKGFLRWGSSSLPATISIHRYYSHQVLLDGGIWWKGHLYGSPFLNHRPTLREGLETAMKSFCFSGLSNSASFLALTHSPRQWQSMCGTSCTSFLNGECFFSNLIFLWPYIMNWLYINYQLEHWLLFIHKIIFSSTCFEPQVLIFRRIQLYTCSLWYCHSLWEFLVACRYTA